ncbi:zinc finger protein GLI2-like [Oppia nitens]|uniref:zinc finger protein GLI2-like n=1 Tax=Oppia nitens TaxID=1686743 RepID=UPI0023DC4FFC|nr:zinc finger protein GLI2-like [Oppia nitens]
MCSEIDSEYKYSTEYNDSKTTSASIRRQSIETLCQMADESKQQQHIHYYYNIGCKWRYKQMRYFHCNPKHQNQTNKLREPLDRRCKTISSKLPYDINNNNVIKQSHNDNEFICDYHSCDKIYKSWFQLQRHRSQHYKVQNKPYLCDWKGCSNQFKKLKNLIIHRRLHTGERPFKCDYENCNKGFRAAHSLSSHRRTHNENYDKTCKLTDKTSDDNMFVDEKLEID